MIQAANQPQMTAGAERGHARFGARRQTLVVDQQDWSSLRARAGFFTTTSNTTQLGRAFGLGPLSRFRQCPVHVTARRPLHSFSFSSRFLPRDRRPVRGVFSLAAGPVVFNIRGADFCRCRLQSFATARQLCQDLTDQSRRHLKCSCVSSSNGSKFTRKWRQGRGSFGREIRNFSQELGRNIQGLPNE